MKTMRVLLTVAAIMVAAVGVSANAFFAEQYYRTNDTNWTATGALCQVTIPNPTCGSGTPQCLKPFKVNIDGVEETHDYAISKKVDNGACQIVTMP